jgi:hypothetical protein
MKKVFLTFLLFCCLAAISLAQVATVDETLARATTEQLTAKYGLNADQAKTVYTIQVRKLKNLAAIETYKTSNPTLYQTKLVNVQQGTLNSLRRSLKSKEQLAIFQKTQSDVRRKKADKRKELAPQKLSKAALDAELNQIYAE